MGDAGNSHFRNGNYSGVRPDLKGEFFASLVDSAIIHHNALHNLVETA